MTEEPSCPVVHSLPIKTTFRGKTDIYTNFTQHTIHHEESSELRNILRGRTLIGREVELPSSYALICARFNKSNNNNNNNNNTAAAAGRLTSSSSSLSLAQIEAKSEDINILACTDKFCVWEHDRKPERPESIRQWIELAHTIHLTS